MPKKRKHIHYAAQLGVVTQSSQSKYKTLTKAEIIGLPEDRERGLHFRAVMEARESTFLCGK
jgi:hypothetical protein